MALVAAYPQATVNIWIKSKGFPDPALVLGAHMEAWNRVDVVRWWQEQQKADA